VLEQVPGAILDVVGEGDHRPDLEAEIRSRGLDERVRMHGYVDEETKAELYGRAWVNLTASQSEGWSLTVMEAALCGTPSTALAVGGLAESIVHGETGFLADDKSELTERVRELVADPALRDRMGDAAERRARTFTWDRSARAFLEVLRRVAGKSAPAELGPAPVSLNGHSHESRHDDEHRSRAAENR
jgi:glycosyltransferase involved in cell wall biosynthesis